MANLIKYKDFFVENPVCLICKQDVDLTEDDSCKWIAFAKKKLKNNMTVVKDFYCIDCYMNSIRAHVTRLPVEDVDRNYIQMTFDDLLR